MNKLMHINTLAFLLMTCSHSVLATDYSTTELYSGNKGRLNYTLLTNIYLDGAIMKGPKIQVYHRIPGLRTLNGATAKCMFNLNSQDTGTALVTYKANATVRNDEIVCEKTISHSNTNMARFQSILTVSGDEVLINENSGTPTSIRAVYTPSSSETIRKVEHSISSGDTGYARVIDAGTGYESTILNGPSAGELGRGWASGSLVARYPTSIELDGRKTTDGRAEELLTFITNGSAPTRVDVQYYTQGLDDLIRVGLLDQAGNVEPGWGPGTSTTMSVDRRVGVALDPNVQIPVGQVSGSVSLTLTIN